MHSFTKKQLFQVRNEIDIDWLINEKLSIERQFNGAWRFRCPVCQELNTATQKKTTKPVALAVRRILIPLI